MVITEEPLITDPEERKKLRDRLCVEYKRLTGVTAVVIERTKKRALKTYAPMAKKHILEITSEYYKITIQDITSQSKKASLVKCRQMLSCILNAMQVRLKDIAHIVGSKDHSTVAHAIKTIVNYIKVDKQYREEYKEYKQYCIDELSKKVKVHPSPLTEEQKEAIIYSVKKGGITHQELADIYGVSQTTISKYVKQKKQNKKNK